jgi:phosphonate transport system substrate-binding protein
MGIRLPARLPLHPCAASGPRLLAVVILLATLFAPAVPRAQEALVFGVVPQQSASRLARVWAPLLDHLAAVLERPVRFATAKDIPTFEACLAAGAYDIAYMNPYHYVVFSARIGYRAVAHQADRKLRGILVARADGGLTALSDLDGKTVAFPSPAAFGASVLTQAEAAQAGVTLTPVYVRSHDSVYHAVAGGHVAAGGGVLRTWATVPESVRGTLRIIHRTGAYTPHAFAVSADLYPAAADAVAAALTDAGPAVLEPLGMTGIVAASDAAWDDVRALDLSVGETEIVTEGRGSCLSG